ncbi:MFS transporter [Halosolutus gelatinilyticus]|uniref:MFS transporter n=1 Tax=Halosolutus gelatinilyticus TaxID=2931975 RepID=UPI001FF35574|nr:MFS transporter [Halosolutus gelatinilyticus]
MADASDPAAVAEAAAAFREEYEDGDAILDTVLDVDAKHDSWTFDDVPLDSGTFGELVSRGLVTKVDGEYRVSSRQGVKAGLAGEEIPEDRSTDRFEFSIPIAFDARATAALVGALAVLVGMRLLNYRSVFRGGAVVSPGNDPYYYRYWMERMLAESGGITDVSVITDMPVEAAERRPVTHAANWFFAELLGGDQWAADMVAAWLPIVATVVLGVVVYWLAVVVTDDVRVGIASLLLLALTPAHAAYTGVGFLEHRLHQYLWLGVTLLTLAWLAVDLERRWNGDSAVEAVTAGYLRHPWTWIAAVVLGIALSFSALSWGGSVLMFMPVAAYAGLKVAIDVRSGFRPALANAPILVGLVLSSVLIALLHVSWGWHEAFTAIVPVLVVGGAVVTIGLGELWRRLGWPISGLLILESILVGGGFAAFRFLRPEEWARLRAEAADLFFREGIAETTSLFTLDDAIVFGPLAQLGLTFYLGILVVAWACWIASRRYEPGWLLLSVYVVFWLLLATLQGRFAAQLAIPLSVFGGMGFVWILAWADLARIPAPLRGRDEDEEDTSDRAGRGTVTDGGTHSRSIIVPRSRWTLVAIVWIGLLVCSGGLFYTPSLVAQTAYSDSQYEAAMAIDEHATETGREYPENFVLSKWGDNRMYNYFVSGESKSYSYAINKFDEFQADGDPDEWYEEFERNGVGYVVMTDSDSEYSEPSAQARLHDDYGAGGDDADPLKHYQAIYLDEDTTAFAVVPGATIVTTGEPGETMTVKTEATVSGETVTYEREVTVDEDGTLEVTVPYPGKYTVGDREIDVPTAAVENGSRVESS